MNKIVGIKFTEEDLDIIDEAAHKDQRARSQYIRKAAIDQANRFLIENGRQSSE